MTTMIVVARVSIVIVAALSAVIYAMGSRRKDVAITRFVMLLFAGYAFLNVVFVLIIWTNRIAVPHDSISLEGASLQQVERLTAGQALYPAPSSDYIPFAYNPLYYILAVPFTWAFGLNLTTLRLVTILGSAGTGIVIYLAVRKLTGSMWWALLAIGMFAASYRVMDHTITSAHPDSWLLFSVTLGCYLMDDRRSRLKNVIGVFMLVAAFWFKQHGALFLLGATVYVTWRDGMRQTWGYWLIAGILGAGCYILAPSWLLGPSFHYYTWEVPRHWTELNFRTIGRIGKFILLSYPLLAPLGVVVASLAIFRLRGRCSIWYFMLPIAILSGFMGALDPGSSNNVFVAMSTWFIITGVAGLKQFFDRFDSARVRGLSFLVLGVSFAVLFYDPRPVIVSPEAPESYQDLVGFLKSLDGPVYAPWIGQMPDSFTLSPSLNWVALEDLIRGPGVDERNNPVIQRLLEKVSNPGGPAYILINYPLENDPLLGYLAERYTLGADLGTRFEALAPLTERFDVSWPKYLYKYAPPD